ncbi:MAG: aminoacyl-tRNA hydrolase [Chloroflexi bacterium RBG_16_54_18]|nr:MAG: aminoacyl-tRNA hydrolase [Chloroflexi bacterium RBG_16_54_18]
MQKRAPGEKTAAFLIVGLGNPGRQYRENRHNIGFLLMDSLAKQLDTRFTRLQSKALVGKTHYHDNQIILAKPQTFMNLSGQAAASLVNFYKIPPNQLMIAYDDVDLPFGAIRIRPSGGSAGHNGMNSIIEKLGTQEFPRLRMGVGRPPGRMDAAAYVLLDFHRNEAEGLQFLLDRAVEAVLLFISDGLQTAMNKYNSPE